MAVTWRAGFRPINTPTRVYSRPSPSSADSRRTSLLNPLGQHRRIHVKPSKGKRASKKDKIARAKAGEPLMSEQSLTPPKPDIGDSVDVGFNSITKGLETHSKDEEDVSGGSREAYSVVFVARGNQSSVFNYHFPQMVGAAARGLPSNEPIRLVGFSKPCSERLGNSLGLPRVSSLAIRKNAPGAGALLDFVEKHVSPIRTPWLDGQIPDFQYQATQIGSIETTIGSKRIKQTS